MIKIIRKLRKINLKSLILNFRLFKFKTALKMPILVNKKTKVKGIKKGIIILPDVVTTGMIQIGFSDIDFISEKDTLTSLNINEKGKLVIKGKTVIGAGCKISIGNGGVIIFNENVILNGNDVLISYKSLEFGKDTLVSWNCQFMDTDFHTIIKDGSKINDDKSISIGEHVWIGSNVTVLKGVCIPKETVIGANSVVSKSLPKANSVYAGNPICLLKEDIEWKR